jgi:integral membrane sensor domain MASE1
MLAGNAHISANFLLRVFVSWLGNLEGIIAIAPLVLLVGFGAQFRRPMIPIWKYSGILCLLILSLGPFTLNFPRANSYPVAFLPYPILIGIALYLGFPFAAFAGALSTLTITYSTISGRGPFDAANNRLESFAAVTAFMFVLVETTLLIGIIMQERREEIRRKEYAQLLQDKEMGRSIPHGLHAYSSLHDSRPASKLPLHSCSLI